MGSRKKSSSRSSQSTQNSGSASGNMNQAMAKLPPVTAQSTQNMFNGMFGQQMGAIGQMLGPLIQGATQQMNSNPGLANFAQHTGHKIQGFEQPEWLTQFAEAAKGMAPQAPAEPAQPAQPQQPAWMAKMSPEQQARFQNWRAHQQRFGR